MLSLNLPSAIPAIKLSGARWYNGTDGGSEGVAILNYWSQAGNRQILFADSSLLSSTTAPGIRFFFGGDTPPRILSCTPTGAYVAPLNINDTMMVWYNGNVGIGTDSPASKLSVVGNVTVTGNIAAKYQDIAEYVASDARLEPGTVLITDPTKPNHVLASSSAYDTRVAGVVTETPGLILGEADKGKIKAATAGRVKVNVDASYGSIEIGDLLVTSPEPGAAMRSEPLEIAGVKLHRPGTLLGKALEPLKSRKGQILVLLSLQ